MAKNSNVERNIRQIVMELQQLIKNNPKAKREIMNLSRL